MKTRIAAGALRRLAAHLLAFCALLAASNALAQLSIDTHPATPRVGDYVTLNISGSFMRHDFRVTDAALWELRPASTGSTREYIAEVDVYYWWSPRYDGAESRTPFTATVGLGQFANPATVEVRVRFFPYPGLPAFYDPMAYELGTVSITSGTATCPNELNLGSPALCTPTVPFGTYRFGERSREIPVIIRNTSRDVMYFGNFSVNNADYGMTRQCGETLEPGASCQVLLTFSPSIDGASPGRLTVNYSSDPDAVPFRATTVLMTGDARAGAVQGPASGTRVVEFHAQSTDQYFLTANENEMRLLDGAGAWRRTGVTFLAAGDQLACRFYGDPVAGPRGHFFTARVDQCDALKLQDSITPRGREVYRYEGLAFPIALPLVPVYDGRWRCPDNSRAIYQFRRDDRGGLRDIAYRLVPAGSVQGGPNGDNLAREMLAAGWAYEGHVMCSAGPLPEE